MLVSGGALWPPSSSALPRSMGGMCLGGRQQYFGAPFSADRRNVPVFFFLFPSYAVFYHYSLSLRASSLGMAAREAIVCLMLLIVYWRGRRGHDRKVTEALVLNSLDCSLWFLLNHLAD